jgi:hypothetical protein
LCRSVLLACAVAFRHAATFDNGCRNCRRRFSGSVERHASISARCSTRSRAADLTDFWISVNSCLASHALNVRQ